MSGEPWTRISAHGICVSHDQILLVRVAPIVPEPGTWTLPGGQLEWGEAPAEALVREFAEETGLEVATTDLVGVASEVYENLDSAHASVHIISVIHTVTVNDGQLVHEIGGTTDLAGWHRLDELEQLPIGSLARPVIESYLADQA